MHARYSASKWRRCEDYRGGFSAFIKADMQLLSAQDLLQHQGPNNNPDAEGRALSSTLAHKYTQTVAKLPELVLDQVSKTRA